MKLKQTFLLVIGLLPIAAIAQNSNTQPPSAPPANLHLVGTPGIPAPTGLTNKALTAVPAPPVMPEKGKYSYAIGMFFGSRIAENLKRGQVDLDTNAVLAAISDVVAGKPTQMTQQQSQDTMNQLRNALQAKQRQDEVDAKSKGEAYLAKFAKEPGVVTLTNGLEYKVLKEGTGPMPKDNDSVVVNYKGTFIDGKEFQHQDGFNASISGGIIPGWKQILPLMKTGSKWQVVIPSDLAYGARGRAGIPGNATLIFEMELVSVKPSTPPTPPPPPKPAASTTTPSAPSSTPVVSGQIIKVPSADELKKGAKIEVINGGQTNVINSQ